MHDFLRTEICHTEWETEEHGLVIETFKMHDLYLKIILVQVRDWQNLFRTCQNQPYSDFCVISYTCTHKKYKISIELQTPTRYLNKFLRVIVRINRKACLNTYGELSSLMNALFAWTARYRLKMWKCGGRTALRMDSRISIMVCIFKIRGCDPTIFEHGNVNGDIDGNMLIYHDFLRFAIAWIVSS